MLYILSISLTYPDIHPDPHYKLHSSTEEEDACHRGSGVSGIYGAETTDCDSPFALVNETFKWIEQNLKDQVDFVIWTGDSARHDNDEQIPRDQVEVLETNTWVADRFIEVFSVNNDPQKSLSIPIIPTFGNNDILPHNILLGGPNKWLKAYSSIWSKFVPEEQRHGFERGGWFYVEVIPNQLAVFSLNTLYFFNNNAAVDGCALRSEPGYEHLEWLRIQLQFMRDRGMKAILTGHVPPARTENKQLWDETCWQKYTLWLQQFRDVIVGGFYGHMNIDHFVLHDSKDVHLLAAAGEEPSANTRATLEDELSIKSSSDYLQELRTSWSSLPYPTSALKKLIRGEFDNDEDDATTSKKKKSKHGKKKKGKKPKKDPFKKIGGPFGERFQVTHVGPSVVPNYFPTLRIVEYNITGLDPAITWASQKISGAKQIVPQPDDKNSLISAQKYMLEHPENEFDGDDQESINKRKKKQHRKPKKPNNPDLHIPAPPSLTSPPGPAYSPQTFTLLGFTQYFANLTYINNDHFVKPDEIGGEGEFGDDSWHKGKHHGKHPKDKVPHPKKFEFQVEYSTFNDTIYHMKDLTVRSYIELAHRIGQYKQEEGNKFNDDSPIKVDEHAADTSEKESEAVDAEGGHKKKKKDKKKKHRKQKDKNQVWLNFIRRAFVGTLDEDQLFLSLEEPVVLASAQEL